MIPETRDEEEYQKLPAMVRFTIRLSVYIMNILHKQLKPYNMSPVFAIYENEDTPEIEMDYEDEDLLQ